MEPFSNKGNIKFILEEIKKTNTFYNSFKKEFSESIFNIIQVFYPDTTLSEEMDNLLLIYSVEILNSTESVLDKDRTYPLYRLEEELSAMNRITSKLSEEEEYNDFGEAIHLKAKALIVNHFAAIYNLSSDGFRLLEKNARLYNREFVANFNLFLQQTAHS